MKRATAHVARTPAPAAAPVHIDEQLKAERIQELLQGLPGWRVAWGGRAIMRRYALPGHNSVAAFIENVGDLARKRGLRADLDLRPSRVTVRVVSRLGRGLTMAELNLACAIDEKE